MSKKVSATAPTTAGKQYHIECKEGDVSRYVILPGDPGRVAKIASVWDDAYEVAHHREYHTMTGRVGNTEISCTSTGIGAPSLLIGVDELARIGADTFIRLGTCGGLQKGMNLGDVVISTGAVRFDGASKDLVSPEYPAVAQYEVVMALVQAAEELAVPYHVGITASTDSFYTGQGRPALNNYMPSFKENILRDMQAAGVKNFEMEVAPLLTFGSVFGKRTGALCFVIANRVTDEFEIRDEWALRAARVVSRGIVILTQWDSTKTKKYKQFFYPALLEETS